MTLSAVTDSVASLRHTLGHRRGLTVTAKPGASSKPGSSTEPETATKPETSADATDAGTVTGPDTNPTAPNGATDLRDGNKAVPRTKAPQSPVQQRVDNSATQVRTSLDRFADTLRKALTPHRAPQRTSATPAPASDAS
ncbi:MAG: hypothetical protein HY239_01510 [Mycolicibacterium aromaticivorans]|nr:hypothetical protein [Mycolicibacterium aromaticivorans]